MELSLDDVERITTRTFIFALKVLYRAHEIKNSGWEDRKTWRFLAEIAKGNQTVATAETPDDPFSGSKEMDQQIAAAIFRDLTRYFEETGQRPPDPLTWFDPPPPPLES